MVNMVSFPCDRCTFDVGDESSFWRKSLFWQKRDIVKVDSILSLAPKSIDEKDANILCAKGKWSRKVLWWIGHFILIPVFFPDSWRWKLDKKKDYINSCMNHCHIIISCQWQSFWSNQLLTWVENIWCDIVVLRQSNAPLSRQRYWGKMSVRGNHLESWILDARQWLSRHFWNIVFRVVLCLLLGIFLQ